jgi:HEAT repeat protein
VLVTARPLDEPGFAGFGRVELRPLQMSEMMALAMTFASNQRHTELARQFCARLRGSDGRRARELARRPGHALQMLDVYFQTNGTVLIEYEEDLLDRVADDRLAKQIHASGIPNSTVLRQRQVLEYLAFQALVNFNGAALTHERMCDLSRLAQRQTLEGGEEVFTQPDGEAMLEDLRKRTGLLRRRWDGRWDFETIVWQEFLAACHFARMLERPESDLRKWLIGGPDSMANEAGGEAGHFSSRPFGAYLWHRAWHPWLLYTAGRMADGSELLTRTLAEKDCVFWRMLTLAIQMLARSTTVRLKILEQVQNKLEGLWSSPWFRTSNKDAVALISLGLARNPEYARCLNSALIQLLGTNRHTEQAFAVAALIQIGDPGALEAFMRLAADPGSAMDLRERSVAGIGRIATAGAVRTLMAFASDDSLPKPVRTRAVAELGRIGATEATGLLENIRRENTGGLAVFAAFALESITGSAVVQATVQNPPTGTPPKSEETSLWEDDELFQLLKLQANKMGQAFPEAEKLLDLPDSPELVETLCSVALDKTAKPDLRVAAVERLSRMENERVREGLLPIVEDHEDVFLVRLMALVSVATSDSLRVSEALVKILGDEQDHLRERVAVALERRRDSTAANAAACLVMAGRGTPKMIGLCLRILSATGGVEAIPAIRKALAWQDMEVRRAAVTAAGDCADVKHAKELLAMARQAIAENSPLASTWIESLWRLSERHCLRMFEDGHPMPFPELQRKLP